jgi:nitroreductase
MELLQGLLNRVSIHRLESPAPTSAQLEIMLQAALRAPDHANLKPWRSVMVAGQGLAELGQIMHQAQLERAPESDPQTLERCSNMPHRAPSILVLIASPKEHPKVPEAEQIQATAAAGHAILLAAHAQNIGAVWRTGWVVSHPMIREAFDIKEHEQIIAMIYLGTPSVTPRPAPTVSSQDFIKHWH